MKAYRRSRGVAPVILSLGTRCRWVVTFSPHHFTPGRNPRFLLNRKLGRPQTWYVLFRERFPVPMIEPRTRCAPHQTLFGWHLWGRWSSFGFSVGKHGGKRPLEDLVVDGRLILKWVLKKWGGRAWVGFIWRRIGANDGFQTVRGVSWLSEDLLASHQELCACKLFGRCVSEAANRFAARVVYYLVIWVK